MPQRQSHLVSAEEAADPVNALQLARFRALHAHWPRTPACLANSSGVFLGPGFHFDLARPGAALYGVAPMAGRPNPMRPVGHLQGRLIQRREVAEGECVGYNHTWRAPRASRIAKGGGQRRHERLVGNSQPTHKQQRSRQDPAKCRQRNACSTAVIRELSSLFKWQDWS